MKTLNINFGILYTICGLTDVVDGYLARKWKVSSRIGALLDSVADVVFITAVFVSVIPKIIWQDWMLWWIAGIALIRGMSLVTGGIRYKTIAFIHTYGNKFAGLLVFVFPLLYMALGLTMTIVIVCIVASVSALEELMMMVSLKTLDRDRKGIFK